MIQRFSPFDRIAPNRRLTLISAVAACALCGICGLVSAQESEEFNPEVLYGPQLGGEATTPKKGAVPTPAPGEAEQFVGKVTIVNDAGREIPRAVPLNPGKNLEQIAAWATEPQRGPLGRPLPLAASWNVDEPGWGPNTFMGLMKEGHAVILNFLDPSSEAMREFFAKDSQKEKALQRMEHVFETYYKPGLEFARQNKLPISFRGWNWADSPVNFQERVAKKEGREVPTSETASLLMNGVRGGGRTTDPFGPTQAWVDWGKFWFGNALLKRIQEFYPDPPMVVFLNNNEAGEAHSPVNIIQSDRFKAKFGVGPFEEGFGAKKVFEAYSEKYDAMFAAAKEQLIAPAWRKNVRLVAYNLLWAGTSIGMGSNPRPGYDFDNEKGWLKWRRFDGDMTELYSNDWQGAKNEIRLFSMQAEASNLAGIQDWVLDQNPDYLLTTIFWDGGVPGNVFRGRRAVSKSFAQITGNWRWSFERYEGWVQFCLWMTRPRMAFEFRAAEPYDAHYIGVWRALLDSVDRPWNQPVLKEFWRHGKLVANRDERPALDGLNESHPEWVRNLDRWFLLTNDANPPRSEWDEKTTRLNVFAFASELGEKPNRRWLIYAHAPVVARENVKVVLPEYGLVQLPSVPQSGSFFLLDEAAGTFTTLLAGGPDQIRLSIPVVESDEGRVVPVGQDIAFEASLAHAPNREFKSFTWDFGDGQTSIQDTLNSVTHAYAKPGTYYVTIEGTDSKGGKLREQQAVFVGEASPPEVIYDLALDNALEWEGPWGGGGEDGKTLITYRHVPNPAKRNSGVAVDAKFVDDPERGRVMELSGIHSGLWLARNKNTVMTGEKGTGNRTIAFSFKADTVEGRQVLFASGLGNMGVNIYLDGDRLYAGSWAAVKDKNEVIPPMYGYDWKGNWIEYGPIEPGKWYDVAWMVKDGINKVEPDRQRLYVNGSLVGKAPGAAIPVEYMPPRLGRAADSHDLTNPLTRFHDQEALDAMRSQDHPPVKNFKGRLSKFRYVNSAVE